MASKLNNEQGINQLQNSPFEKSRDDFVLKKQLKTDTLKGKSRHELIQLLADQENIIKGLEKQIDKQKAANLEKNILLEDRLIDHLHQTQEELLFHRTQLLPSSVKNAITLTKRRYGARDEVIDSLPYRLGRLINEYSKTPKGITKLPKLIMVTYEQHQQEQKDGRDQSLQPSLEAYIDSNEGEKVKNHLNYRLGLVIAQTIESPENVLMLPLRVLKQIYLFKKSRL